MDEFPGYLCRDLDWQNRHQSKIPLQSKIPAAT
jgi:hypothetical protein